MLGLSPAWAVGQAVYFRYIPYEYLNPATGEVFIQSCEIPATVLAVAHNFNYEVEIAQGVYLARLLRPNPVSFYYFVEIDQEEAALMGLDLRCPQLAIETGEAAHLTTEVLTEKQITNERIAF